MSEKSRGSRRLFVKPVGSFVPKLTQKAFEKYGFSTVTLLTDWDVIVGADFCGATRPERLKWPRKVAVYDDVAGGQAGRPGATLVLRVDPSQALEIQYGLDKLIERINGYFGYNAIAKIRIIQAPVTPSRVSRAATAEIGKPEPRRSFKAAEGRGGTDDKRQSKSSSIETSPSLDSPLRAALLRLQGSF